MPKKLDLTGQKFGRLTVIEEVGRDIHGNTKWRCKCECGGEIIVYAGNLRKGYTKSCGCLRKETKFKVGQKFGRLTIIERATNDKHGQTMWKCKCECGKDTIVNYNALRDGRTKSCGCLNREISSERAKSRVNILLDKLKRDEFKEGTSLAALTKKKSKNNTSGTKGVYWNKRSKKWYAQIDFKGKRYNLGYFTNKQDAINARKKAEEELFEPILEKYNKKKAD